MTIDHIFDENRPIYLQIVQRINAKIVRGVYQRGEKLPSVIEAAMLYKVNHNTMARVYTELIRAGVAEVRRGEGTFVTMDDSVLKELETALIDTIADDFINEVKALGFPPEEILRLIEKRIQMDSAAPEQLSENDASPHEN